MIKIVRSTELPDATVVFNDKGNGNDGGFVIWLIDEQIDKFILTTGSGLVSIRKTEIDNLINILKTVKEL